jgi:hypothetical protein
MEDLFDTIAGLPIHPLVVHAAVVLLPLGALGLIAMVVKPTLQERYGSLIMAARVGSPGEHEEWGERLVMSAMLLTVVALVWWIRRRRSQRSGSTAAGAGLLGGAAALLGVIVIGMAVAAGHSGATAAWADRISASESKSATPTTSATKATTTSLTAAAVATHASATDCWTIVDGQVYDLTSWVNRHPGGEAPIESLCGQDGSAAFREQHGSQGEPNERLASFLLGPVAAS